MRIKRFSGAVVAAALWMTLLIRPVSAADAIFRCGSNTAVRGDTTVRVLSLCGKPDFKEDLGEKEEAVVEPGPGYTILYKKEKKRVEKWHYNRGYGDYIYSLTFENGLFESVESTGRGY
jgi:Protein of unknown function (DUF2845)